MWVWKWTHTNNRLLLTGWNKQQSICDSLGSQIVRKQTTFLTFHTLIVASSEELASRSLFADQSNPEIIELWKYSKYNQYKFLLSI